MGNNERLLHDLASVVGRNPEEIVLCGDTPTAAACAERFSAIVTRAGKANQRDGSAVYAEGGCVRFLVPTGVRQ